MSRAYALPLALLLCLCPGCLNLRFVHAHSEEPLRDEQIDALLPHHTTLAEALKQLGAPIWVWEYHRDGMALAWAWSHTSSFGFTISYSPLRYAPSASFKWDDASLDRPGCVLWFGADLVLESAKRGKLRDLMANLRQRPSVVEGD